MDKLRLKYKKVGRSIYISHLDLMRTMQRAFMRANLPLKYSEGFNPHPLISMALPLSLGVASECEIMDFRVTQDVDIDSLACQLNMCLPEGIEVSDVWEPSTKAAHIKYLETEGVLEYDSVDAEEVVKSLRELFCREELVIKRRTKRGEGEFELRAHVKNIEFSTCEGEVHVRALVSAQEPTVSHVHLMSAIEQLAPEIKPDFSYFTRLEVYDAEMRAFS